MFKTLIRTKNHSSADLRGNIMLPFRSIVRLGSTTPTEKILGTALKTGKRIIECNTPEAIENSRNKLKMKDCFTEAKVPQADWWIIRNNRFYNGTTNEDTNINNLPYPILIKRINGFKGHGMFKIDSEEQLEEHMRTNSINGSYIENFMNFGREYRLHCTQDRCFMAWRKLRKSDTPENRRWFFNSENCNWVGEDNTLFDKPTNWDTIIDCCIKAIKEVGLDIGCFDVRIQTSRISNPQFIIVEVNSAPSLASKGIDAYKVEISRILYKKYYNK